MSAFQASTRNLYVVGAGGFGREVAWLASSILDPLYVRFVVDRPDYLASDVAGHSVTLLSDVRPEREASYVVAVGESQSRRRLAGLMDLSGFIAHKLIHPNVLMSNSVKTGRGSIICAGSILTVDIEIGEHVHINLGCTVGHDAKIGNFSTLAPGVHISGNVVIGSGVFLGTGATVINGSSSKPLIIGNGAIVAAGACVTRNVEAGAMVAGVPAERRN